MNLSIFVYKIVVPYYFSFDYDDKGIGSCFITEDEYWLIKITLHNIEILQFNHSLFHCLYFNIFQENVDHKLKNATKRFLCCKHCKKTFTVRKDLVEHLKTHEFRDSFCVICEKQFSSTEALDKHLRLRSVYSCSVCRYITHCKQRLTRHHAMHKTKEEMVLLNDEQPAPASQTHTKENNTSAGETLKTDSGSFRCPACDEIFIDYQELKTHSTSGCNRLICKYCNKIFLPSKSRQYNRHLKTHKIKKRFSCPYCPYICDRKRSLTDHISKHTGEYRFSCSLCDYKCTRNVSLKLHMEKKHKDVNCIPKSE